MDVFTVSVQDIQTPVDMLFFYIKRLDIASAPAIIT